MIVLSWLQLIPFSWWSWILLACGIIGIWNAGNKKSWGWLIGIGVQVLWFTYAVVSDQNGFIFQSMLYAAVYYRNYRRWQTEQQTAFPVGPIKGTAMKRSRCTTCDGLGTVVEYATVAKTTPGHPVCDVCGSLSHLSHYG